MAILALLAVLVVLHLPPARRVVASWAEDRLGRAIGARVEVGQLDYSFPSLRATAGPVRISASTSGATPFFEADRVLVDVPWAALRGAPRLDAIELTRPRVRLEEVRAWLAARPARKGPPPGRFDVGRVAIEDLTLAGYPDTAAFSIDLDGLSLAASPGDQPIAGPVTARGGSFRVGPYRTAIRELSGTLGYDGQRILVQPLRVVTSDHRLEATGDVLILTSSPAWNVDVGLSGDVGPVLASWPAAPTAKGTAVVRGRVTGPLSAPRLSLRASSGATEVGGVPLSGIDATVEISETGVVVQRAVFTAFGGTVEGSLTRPFVNTSTDALDVTWRDVDVGALLRELRAPFRVHGRSRGTATLEGPLDDPRRWRLEATSRFASSTERAAGLRGDARLALRERHWTAALKDGALGAARIGLDLKGQLPLTGERTISQSTVSGAVTIDADEVSSVPDTLADAGVAVPGEIRARLGGAVSLRVGVDGHVGTPDLDTRFDRAPLAVRGLGTVTLDGALTLDAGRTLASEGLVLRAAGGSVGLAGSVDVRTGALAARVDAEGLALGDLGTLALPAGWQPAGGTLAWRGSLAGTLRRPRVDGTLDVHDVEWAGQRIDRATGRLLVEGGRVQVAPLDVVAGEGRTSLAGSVGLDTRTLDLTVTSSSMPLRPLVLPGEGGAPRRIALGGRADVTLRVHGAWNAPIGSGRVSVVGLEVEGARPGSVGADVTLPGDGTVRVAGKIPALGTTATGTVALSRPWAFDLIAGAVDLDVSSAARAAGLDEQRSADVSGALSIDAKVTGTLADVSAAEGTLAIDRFDGRVYGIPLQLISKSEIRATAEAFSTGGLQVRTGTTTLDVSGALPRRSASGTLRLRANGALADFAPAFERVTGRKVEASGALALEVSATGTAASPRLSGGFTVGDATLRAPGWPDITAASLRGALGDGRLEVTTSSARVGPGAVALTATAPLRVFDAWLPDTITAANPADGTGRLTATLTNVTLATLGSFAGNVPGSDLAGSFDVTIDVSADRPALDALAGTARIGRAVLSVQDLEVRQAGTADFRIDRGKASFDEWRWRGARTDIALLGSIDVAASPFTYDIEARGPIDLTALGAVIPGRTAGHVRADVRARRVNGRPEVNGELFVSKGAWVDPALQVALSGLSGTVRLQTDRIVLEGMTGRFNGGDLTVTGEMTRQPDGGYGGAITLDGRRLTVEFPHTVVNDVDAQLKIASPGPGDTTFGVTGRAVVRPGPLRASLRQLALMVAPAPEPLPTPAVERRRRLTRQVGLDIQIDTAEDVIADSNELRAQAAVNVRLTGTLAEPGLLGKLEIRDDGELFFVGRLYELRGGQVDFVNPTAIEPRINLIGETRISDYEVQLQMTGPVDRIDFRLRSDPPLSQGDLASLLTTGQTLKERREQATEAASDAARAQMLSAVSSEYLGAIGRKLGVDTVRIETSARDLSAVELDPVSRLTVTKRLGALFEVVYSQSIEESDDVYWILVLEPDWHNLELASKFTTQEGETYELRQELNFGGGSRPASGARKSRSKRPGPKITEVSITGVPANEAREIEGRLSLGRGDRFDMFTWQRDRERVERYYRDHDRLRATVAATREPADAGAGTQITYAVEPGVTTRLRVEGYDFSRAAVEALRRAWAESPVDEFVDEALRESARIALARDGFLQAQVDIVMAEARVDLVDVTVRVAPGPRVSSRTFSFSGNAAFSSSRLTELLAAAGLGPEVWVTPEVVVPPIQAYYAAAGYLGVEVTASRPEFDGTRAVLPVRIDEGRQFKVSSVDVAGILRLPEHDVRTAFGLVHGSVYTAQAASEGTRRVTSLYGRRGHRQAGVRLSTAIDRANQAVKLAIAVDEGVREVVAEVASGGEDVITSPKMVARAMQVSPGQPVDSHAIEEAQRKLYDLGVFRSVEPRFEPAGDPATAGDGGVTQPVKVVFDLQEYPRYRLRYGFQVATGAVSSQEIVDSGPRPGGTVDLRRSNLFGRAVDASAGAFVSTDRYRLRGLLTSTTLAGRPVQSTLSVTREHREQTTADYVESASRTLISAEQRWRPIRRVEFAYGYELDYQDREIAIVPLAAGEAFSFPLSARIASVFGTWTYDSRDNVLNPTKGMFHSANVETGTSWLASEIGYAQYLGQHFFYVPAGRATWASGIRFGSVGILDEQEESIEATLVRFRTGGGTTVRGYRQDDLTPRYVGRIYRGGDVLLVLNQEVRVPLWSWLDAVGFVDAGNAFREWGDFSLGDLQVGVGAGLRLVSPFGVVRLDLGFPRPRPSNYPLALWYFSFGHAF